MVGTPPRRNSSRHRRAASIKASWAIAKISPVRPSERRAERNRIRRDRRRRADARFYRDLLIYCGHPQQPRRRRRVPPPTPEVEAPILVSSDTSAEDLPQPQLQQRPIEVVDLDTTGDSLPNIDPRPQWQLPEQPLPDLGPIDMTAELAPQLQNQTFREAYVLLQRMQVPRLQQLTPPPEFPPREIALPPEQDEGWLELEVADFDGSRYVVLKQPLALQQPQVAPVPEHVPAGYQQPPPMPAIDWALIAHALFAVAEREHGERVNNTN